MTPVQHVNKRLADVTGLSRSVEVTRSVLRRHLWLWPILGALVLGGLGWWVHWTVEAAMRERLVGELTTVLRADVEALRVWRKDQETIARLLAHSPGLRPVVKELVAAAAKPDAPHPSAALAQIRALMLPSMSDTGFVGFFVVTPSMQLVASNRERDERLGSTLDGYRLDFVRSVLHGPAAVSLPFRATILLPDAMGELKLGVPTMYVAAAIPDERGEPLGVLVLRMRPEAEFTAILQSARFGQSGETYAVSDTGLLLSGSRFDSDLKRLGLLADLPDAQSVLTVEVRDPQVNLMEGERPALSRADQPLTRLASKAVAGGRGVEMEPYRDYRGVTSVGAWEWLPEFGYGVATEVDVAEAFGPLYVLRTAIWGLFGLLLLSAALMFAGMVVIARQQRRMEKAQHTINQLGQYRLEEKLGAGGMGSVYRARHSFLKRPTAVKMLDAAHAKEGAAARFEREVQLTGSLCHPNTIAVYDYGRTAEGVFYYAMECLEGINLEDLVKQGGPLPDGRIVNILEQVCGSLAEAHGIGLIHRDVKPANIFLTARAGLFDFVKVLDFGLVKVVDADEEAKLTQVNTVLGTPYYLSPEAVERPDSVTALSDVYAIGAVGYFLLTGTTVFTGKTIMDVCMKHVRTVPDPPSKRLGRPVSPGLEALILRCLAKDPAGRPQGARALMDELARCEPSQPWTRADAEAWWSAFNQTRRPGPSLGATVAGPETHPNVSFVVDER